MLSGVIITRPGGTGEKRQWQRSYNIIRLTVRLYARYGIADTFDESRLVDGILEPWHGEGQALEIAVHSDTTTRRDALREIERDGEHSGVIVCLLSRRPSSWTSGSLHLCLCKYEMGELIVLAYVAGLSVRTSERLPEVEAW